MKKYKYVCLCLLVTCLIIGLGSVTAAETNTTDTQKTITDTNTQDTIKTIQNTAQTQEKDNNIINKEVVKTNTKIKENKTQETKEKIKQIQTNKNNKKTTNKTIKQETTVNVNNYEELKNSINNATTESITINLNNGTYNNTQTITLDTQTCKNITINGNNQTIQGNQKQFLNVGQNFIITLNSLKITNCYMYDREQGQAIHNHGTVVLNNTMLYGNHIDSRLNDYGTIYNDGKLTIDNTNFTNNTGSSIPSGRTFGGAIHNKGIVQINNSNFENNSVGTGTWSRGGAIYNDRGNITIQNSNIKNNEARYGGAIFDLDGKITIINTNITNNIAWNGTISAIGTIIINNSNLSNNKVYNNGGVIYNDRGKITINNTHMNNNTAVCGGVIFNLENAHGKGTIVINHSTITNNTANTGGVIYNTGNTTINNTNIYNNTANDNGGAIYNENGNVTIDNTIMNNNKANMVGGAIYTINKTVVMNNVTMNNNKANTKGGAIYNDHTNITINNTNIHNNLATDTGAIDNHGNLTLNNTNMTNNTAANGGAINNDNGLVNINNSNIYRNWALNGGAISNDGRMNIINTNIHNNTANNNGGAIHNKFGKLMLNNTNIHNNAAVCGGAIFNQQEELIINNISMKNNRANDGGAIYSSSVNNIYGNIVIWNSIFINNSANNNGGAIYSNVTTSEFSQGNINITHAIMLNNTAKRGSAIYKNVNDLHNSNKTYGSLELLNSIISGNYASYGTIFNNGSDVNILNTDITNNIAENGGVLYTYGTSRINNSNITNNRVTQKDGYLIFIRDCDFLKKIDIHTSDVNFTYNTLIINNEFINNTDYTRDMLIGNTSNKIIISNNTYNGNYLKTYTTIPENTTLNFTDKNYETTIPLTIRNIYNSTVQEGYIIVLIDGVKYQQYNVNNGICVINIPKAEFNNTKNNITYNYISPNKDYQPLTVNNIVTLIKHNTNITLNHINNTLWDNKINITGTLRDTNGTSLSNTTINVIVNNNTYHTTTDNMGTYTILNLSVLPGKNIISVSYSGNELYNPAESNSTITGLKHNTNINIDQVNGLLGKNVTFKARVTDTNGTLVNEGYVIFKINDITLKDKNGNPIRVNVTNGTAVLTTIATWNNAKNTTVIYKENNKYESSRMENGTINIARQNVTLSMSTDDGLRPGELFIAVVNITDMDNKPVNTGNVLFKMNGKTMYYADGSQVRVNVINGIAMLYYVIPVNFSAKDYNLTVAYTGNVYNRAETTTNFTLSKRDAKINMTINTKILKPGSVLIATANVTDIGGFPVTTGSVVFKLNNKTLVYTNGSSIKVTVADGIARLVYIIPGNYTAKTYTLTAEYIAGNYNTIETSKNITLSKINTYIQPNNIKINGNKLTVKANIINNETKEIADERNNTVSIKLDKHTVIKEVKVQNGEIDLSTDVNVKPGVHTVEIVTSGNGIYNGCRQTFTVNNSLLLTNSDDLIKVTG